MEEKEAKAVCSICTVRPACLRLAVEREESHGIWGGLTPEERGMVTARAVREQRRRLAAGGAS